ncbi:MULTISPECIES: bifunctional DNA-formamidopyrimidine glycosylase/DNA-(apurinic or apyrimidinic site) lyase [unclassified Agarivorans]|uniref:bifunctional DNA-formamidopyrimidine glycosylase/DNA-(apurinic or apyrimidinic site) lyase n=1 Tax=unclassified Agarivorans TaxID=2636026 RepID=UPI0026E1AB09|nr:MULTISPECIES: bifunctional DNA-formamidopyrimidine glycosylase/DNA-(apurinic or apyrimidinic site) lyase [unclassified Agarivorans]MDO6685735.1 bifunctional DNA-formamidopyrimidine glycosylase/DNA-(apurinic or apyrimidinic site) lyase [Agarivorans sp. 3_MG-2023]MDO6716150.1 bifunctional DNA-formamidopyrimidine glycosylase/DNA-(apurinic or apyrimidinic site) lyase [Agarivorans sp. 2_MG-2023]
MPELPEVETSRRGIAPHIEQQVISEIIVRQAKLRWPVPELIQCCVGLKVLAVTRRAKYLLIETEAGHIIIHLGMSGSLRIVDSGLAAEKHDHVDIVLASGKALRLNDPRRFGCVLFSQLPIEQHNLLVNLGPEPLTDEFTFEHLAAHAAKRSVAVKQFIMDNKVVVGVGNIYANEALFRTGIHPKRAANKVSKVRLELLTDNIKQVLAEAIEQGGTSLKDFTNADGKPGYFKQTLAVYGREGEACDSCGELIKALRIGQRNTFYCPHCQR